MYLVARCEVIIVNILMEIERLEKEIQSCQKGYISKKIINGKERYYLQWLDNGVIKSKYIKMSELESMKNLIDKRKQLQQNLKKLKSSEEFKNVQYSTKANNANLSQFNGVLMNANKEIATIKKGTIIEMDQQLIPLYLKRTRDLEGWLAMRAIDNTRANSRLLKKVLRLKQKDDVNTVLAVNGSTLTDNYWIKSNDSSATYEEIRFKDNLFDKLALYGEADSYSLKPARTPELTNIGSFEKCWRLIRGKWWLYKKGNDYEIFSELFISKLSEKLQLPTAFYEKEGDYIRTLDFTDGAKVNYEPIYSLVGEDDDYQYCFDTILKLSKELAKQYLLLVWMDTICFNMDRHTQNFGFLRNVETGEILSLAPNFDNNIALIARGYPKDVSRVKDGLIKFFREFIENSKEAKELYRAIKLPMINQMILDECFKEIDIQVDRDVISSFILNGQRIVNDIIYNDVDILMDEDDYSSLML